MEGKNHKARMMQSKSHTQRSCEVLELAMYHALGEFSALKLTHNSILLRRPINKLSNREELCILAKWSVPHQNR